MSRRMRIWAASGLALLLAAAGGLHLVNAHLQGMTGPPLATLDVALNPVHADALIAELERFADRERMRFRARAVRPEGGFHAVEMWRPGLEVIAVNPEKAGAFQLGIYSSRTPRPDDEALDRFLGGLRDAILRVPTAEVRTKGAEP